LLTIVAFTGTAATDAQTDQSLIRVGASADDATRPLLYAQQAGLFKKAGLDVEIVKLANGAAIAAAVAGGSIEIGKGSSLTAVQAYAKLLPFLAIANLSNYSDRAPNAVIIVRRDSAINSAKDLAGKTLGVIALADFTTLTIQAWLEQNGVDLSTIKYLEIPNSAAVTALEQGRIEATMVIEPSYSSAMATGKVRVVGAPMGALGKQYSGVVLYADATWLARHHDAVIKFNRAVRDASAYVAAHEDETKPLIAQFTGYDAVTLQNLHPTGRALTLDPPDLQPIIDAAVKCKLIPKAFPARDMFCDCALSAGH
jgi:NitT/TauT family transport system substrate-binding protein